VRIATRTAERQTKKFNQALALPVRCFERSRSGTATDPRAPTNTDSENSGEDNYDTTRAGRLWTRLSTRRPNNKDGPQLTPRPTPQTAQRLELVHPRQQAPGLAAVSCTLLVCPAAASATRSRSGSSATRTPFHSPSSLPLYTPDDPAGQLWLLIGSVPWLQHRSFIHTQLAASHTVRA
jgi:hypothetical protein